GTAIARAPASGAENQPSSRPTPSVSRRKAHRPCRFLRSRVAESWGRSSGALMVVASLFARGRGFVVPSQACLTADRSHLPSVVVRGRGAAQHLATRVGGAAAGPTV